MAARKGVRSRRLKTSAEIMARLLQPRRANLCPEAARSILSLDFPAEDQARVETLSTKAQERTLAAVEREELEEFIRVADLLAMLQARARLSLKKVGMSAVSS